MVFLASGGIKLKEVNADTCGASGCAHRAHAPAPVPAFSPPRSTSMAHVISRKGSVPKLALATMRNACASKKECSRPFKDSVSPWTPLVHALSHVCVLHLRALTTAHVLTLWPVYVTIAAKAQVLFVAAAVRSRRCSRTRTHPRRGSIMPQRSRSVSGRFVPGTILSVCRRVTATCPAQERAGAPRGTRSYLEDRHNNSTSPRPLRRLFSNFHRTGRDCPHTFRGCTKAALRPGPHALSLYAPARGVNHRLCRTTGVSGG